jgi:hypothetical protein
MAKYPRKTAVLRGRTFCLKNIPFSRIIKCNIFYVEYILYSMHFITEFHCTQAKISGDSVTNKYIKPTYLGVALDLFI